MILFLTLNCLIKILLGLKFQFSPKMKKITSSLVVPVMVSVYDSVHNTRLLSKDFFSHSISVFPQKLKKIKSPLVVLVYIWYLLGATSSYQLLSYQFYRSYQFWSQRMILFLTLNCLLEIHFGLKFQFSPQKNEEN